MKMKICAILIALVCVLGGCQNIKDFLRDDDPDGKAESLSIETGKRRVWEKEIVIKGEAEYIAEQEKLRMAEKAPNEYIFPRDYNEVQKDIVYPEDRGEKMDINFNFKNADIKEVIYKILGELLDVNYLLDKKVSGQITIKMSGKVYKDELFPILQTMLNINGFTVVKDGVFHRVVPLQNVRQMPGEILKSDKVIKGGKDVITQIVPLKYITPQSIIPTLRTFLTKAATTVAPNDTHVLIIVEDASNMEKVMTIIKTFDLPFFAGKALRFYDIEHLSVKNLAKHLESILTTLGATTKGKKADLAFLPFVEANKLLVATRTPEFFKIIDLWIKNLDIMPAEGERVRTYIYRMQHILAGQVAPIINAVFEDEVAKLKKAPPSIAKKELKIIPDEATNSLIIRATAPDYYRIKTIIEELDAPPQQVLIEVVIAEVKLNDNLQYGVQFFLRDRFKIGDDGTTDLGGLPAQNPQRRLDINLLDSDSPSFTFLTESIGFDMLFSAIAGESSFELLSNPHILVRDDQTATMQVADDTPIVTSRTAQDVGGSQAALTTNVQYRTVGIILSVTPHIGENGMVTLDVSQEDSEAAGVGVEDNPIFTTRKAETSLVVKDGNTILIGGIIETRETENVKKLPILGDIPYLGNLFKSRQRTKGKTELLVLITPHVIDTTDEAERITKMFENKLRAVGGLKSTLKDLGKKAF